VNNPYSGGLFGSPYPDCWVSMTVGISAQQQATQQAAAMSAAQSQMNQNAIAQAALYAAQQATNRWQAPTFDGVTIEGQCEDVGVVKLLTTP
jgi:hypothetical protein